MNIATAELIIPSTIFEIEQRATRALHALPARPGRWSLPRWLHTRRAATSADPPADPAAVTAAMIAADALTRTGMAGTMPRID